MTKDENLTNTTIIPREQDELIDRRYRLIRRLGRGGMGSVYLVEDELHPGSQYALKEIRRDRSDPKSIAILKNEFLALSRMSHPNLASVDNFGFDRTTGDYYFTAEYVRGIQFYKATQGFHLEQIGDLKMLLYLFVEILRTLEFIHSRGFVHGDLKPENLLVSTGSDGPMESESNRVRVKIIDFGLTKREKDFGGKKIFGTSFYIAPETILGSQVDRRTDLYSLGVVFYHMATRRLPFRGKSNFMVLKGHLEEAPPRPESINAAVPEELGDIMLKMMEKKPADRYPNSISVIEDINERMGTRFPIETAETLRSYIESPVCIGRNKEFNELHGVFNAVFPDGNMEASEDLQLSLSNEYSDDDEVSYDPPDPPSGKFILIRGERKIGKGRIIDELKDYVQVRGARFVRVRLEKDAEKEKNNLKKFFESLSKVFVAEESSLQSSLIKLLESLPKAFDEANEFKKTSALELLIDGLLPVCKKVPLVLVFTRLHNAGEYFLKFLRILVQKIANCEERDAQILIIGTVLEEEMDDINLRRLLLSSEVRSHFREIPLERLSHEELEVLIDTMFKLHRFPRKLVDRIYEESDGSPGVVHDILEFFIQSGCLQHTAGGWIFVGNIDEQTIPGRVRSELKERIQALAPEALRLGLAFAFLGNSCELDLAVQLADIPPSKVLPTLMNLKKQRILREDGEGKSDFYSFTQRSAGELFRQLPTPGDRVKIHRRAGTILEERFKAGTERSAERLAFHYLRASRPKLGVKYSLLAANDYRLRHLPRKALESYMEMRKRCDENEIPAVGDVDFQIAVLEATVGNPRASVQVLKKLLSSFDAGAFNGNETTRGDVLIELGKIYYRLGEYRRSGRHFQEAYKSLKDLGVTCSFLRLLMEYGNLFQIRGNNLESFRYCEKALASGRILDNLTHARLVLMAGENHFRLNDLEKAMQRCSEGLTLLDGFKDDSYIALTFFFLGRLSFYKGKFENALSQFGMAAKAFRHTGLPEWEANSHKEMGKILLILGEPLKARTKLLRGYQLDERIENFSGLVDSLQLLGETHRMLGRYEEAEGFLKQALSFINRFGLSRKLREINFTCSRICLDRGNLPQSEEFLNQPEIEKKKNEYEDEVAVLSKLELQCKNALMQGDFRRALDLTAVGSIRARDVKNKRRIIPTLELRARIHIFLGRYSEAERSLTKIREICVQNKLPLDLAIAQMLSGTIHLARGETEVALKIFKESLGIFKQKEAERELAELYLNYGLARIEKREFDKSSIYLEEGFYLVKKLNLVFLRTLYLQAMGKLEELSPEGDPGRAINYFQSAMKLISKHGFVSLPWQIRYAQGQLLMDQKKYPEAMRVLEEAVLLLTATMERVPEPYRESYSNATGAECLDNLLEQAKAQAKTEKVDTADVEGAVSSEEETASVDESKVVEQE